MFNITVLSSFHTIHGNCNPVELHKIIAGIQPEIIFEELSRDLFDIVYSAGYQPQTVEAIAIKNYLQSHSIKHFPVDNYPIKDTDLLSDAKIIWNSSSEYRELWNKQLLKLGQEGYKFLNSAACTDILKDIRTIEETVLVQINNTKLLTEFRSERALHDKRENEMLRAIYNYSKQCPFVQALFICGVDHRQPLLKKIEDYETNEPNQLNWTFYNNIE